jgi:hypothetical protein
MRTSRATLTAILALLGALTIAVPAAASIPQASPGPGSIALPRAGVLSLFGPLEIEATVVEQPCIIDGHDLLGEPALEPERISLRPALDRALSIETRLSTLPETHVWALEQIELFPRQGESLLSRALHQGYAALVGENALAQTVLSPDPLGYRDSSNLYAFAAGDPVNGRDPTGEQYDPSLVHQWLQEKVLIAKTFYSNSDSVAVDALGNTLADVGSGVSSVFNIGTKTGETYVEQAGFHDVESTTLILAAGVGELGETILSATGAVSAGVKTLQTVAQVRSLVEIQRRLNVATNVEEIGELLTRRSLVVRGWREAPSVKIRGKSGKGRGNQGIDLVFERRQVVAVDRTAAVEVKSVNRPDLNFDRSGIQQGSAEFNRTRLQRAADPRLSSTETIQTAERIEAARQAGRLESYKSTYDASKRSTSLKQLVSDPATTGRAILKEIKTWLLW